MLRFVPTNANGLPQKRASSHRACDSCRKRKKRCEHVDDLEMLSASTSLFHKKSRMQDLGPLPSSQERRVAASIETRARATTRSPTETLASRVYLESSLSPTSPHIGILNSPTNTSQHETPRSVPHVETPRRNSEGENSRLVGDLNPEGIFLAATSPSTTGGSALPDRIGVWLSDKPGSGKPKFYSNLPTRNVQSSSIYIPDPITSRLFLSHLEDQCLSLLPESANMEALRKIYLEEIHLIFPIIDFDSIDGYSSQSPTNILLKQVICFAASSSWSSTRFLQLSISGQSMTTLSRKEFSQHMSLAIRTSLNLGIVKDKMSLIQVYALLSLFTQFSGDRHISAELNAQAVTHLQTLGLHHIRTVVNDRERDHSLKMFCCVWALDRLNAAFHGRPILMHERDFGRNLESSIEGQDHCFQLFLRIVYLLDKVVDLYRPKADDLVLGWEENFPHFEDIVNQAGALRVRTNLLATIETLYHAVAILSHRSQSIQEVPHSSPSYVRQSLAAVRVTSIIGEDFHGKLSLLPIVPYAVSLALRVFYRELRFTKVPLFRARARRQMMTACGISRELGDIFHVATVMADLAQQTLNELDKAYSSIMRNCMQDDRERNDNVQQEEAGRVNVMVSNEMESGSYSMEDADNSTIDWSVLDSLPDVDIFEYFDPNFDLNVIDAALADDTNPAFSIDFNKFLS